jgi:hypothetical protein
MPFTRENMTLDPNFIAHDMKKSVQKWYTMSIHVTYNIISVILYQNMDITYPLVI